MSTNQPQPKYGLASLEAHKVNGSVPEGPLTFTKPRATLEELLRFANVVREAGGGNPLHALMPAVPSDSEQCLIAKNLNFNCSVNKNNVDYKWSMFVTDFDLAERIAERIGSSVIMSSGPYSDHEIPLRDHEIPLPEEIGNVASAFDVALGEGIWQKWNKEDEIEIYSLSSDEDARQRLQEFWPYIEASVKEAYENATFINDRGELIL